jgi:hypothetical protein
MLRMSDHGVEVMRLPLALALICVINIATASALLGTWLFVYVSDEFEGLTTAFYLYLAVLSNVFWLISFRTFINKRYNWKKILGVGIISPIYGCLMAMPLMPIVVITPFIFPHVFFPIGAITGLWVGVIAKTYLRQKNYRNTRDPSLLRTEQAQIEA